MRHPLTSTIESDSMRHPLTSTSNPTPCRWAPALILAHVALWPLHGIAEAVLVLGALTFLVHVWRTPTGQRSALLSIPAWALTTTLFAVWWLAQLFSLIDAVDTRRSLSEALADLRYLPFLWLAAAAVSTTRARRITFSGLAVIVLVWTLDALAETLIDASPLFWSLDHLKQLISGHPFCAVNLAGAGRLSGMFGPCNIKLGVVLASLAPFLLYAAGRRFGAAGWIIAAAALGIVIALAGARAAWLTYALALVFSGWHLLGWKKACAGLLGGVLVFGVLALTVPYVGQRLANTTQVLDGRPGSVDVALSGRVKIWQAALCMYRQHPVNGVGTRGFRSAFADCDPNPAQQPEWNEGPALHAHQIVLEILSETGTLGLILWLFGAALAWRAWRSAVPAARTASHPAMLALAVTVFPLNTHLAFYSTFWGGLTLLLVALYAGSLYGQEREPAAPP